MLAIWGVPQKINLSEFTSKITGTIPLMSLPSNFNLFGSNQEIRLTGDNPKIVRVLKLENLLKNFC
jgi:hypothetical protein